MSGHPYSPAKPQCSPEAATVAHLVEHIPASLILPDRNLARRCVQQEQEVKLWGMILRDVL